MKSVVIAAVVLSAMVTGCLSATTVELLSGDPNMSQLVSLVVKAGLVDAINGGNFTIFAPTNDAFAKVSNATLSALASDVNALADLLKYHVVSGSVMKHDAKNELTVQTLAGKNVRFNIYHHNHVVTVEGSKITEFDRVASNGVIHVIDTVMMPPSGDIVDLTAGTSDLSTLLSLVQQAGLAETLKADALTVFAPTNAAFARLTSDQLTHITSDKALLTEILEYHVVHHTRYSSGLFNGEHIRTLDKHHDKVIVHIGSSGVKINNAHVIMADISATNGVVHLIDHVLMPRRFSGGIVGKK